MPSSTLVLDVLGPAGTLVVPTFTFVHGKSDHPVFDPARDASEMGRITETTRTRPRARRSRHLLHSVAALGGQAEEITADTWTVSVGSRRPLLETT